MHLKTIISFLLLNFFIYSSGYKLLALEFDTGFVKFIKSNNIFKVEIADSFEKRKKGLMFRNKLDTDKGMLLVFPEEKLASIWMKNTSLELDIIFISKSKVVVDYIQNVIPMSEQIYTSKKNVKYILEINSGLIKNLNIKLGDKLNIEYWD